MRRLLLVFGAVSLLGVGCGSSSKDLREAQHHQYRADRAAAQGDYRKAAREQDKADRERMEAYEKARLGY
jgi:hypothetical protein